MQSLLDADVADAEAARCRVGSIQRRLDADVTRCSGGPIQMWPDTDVARSRRDSMRERSAGMMPLSSLRCKETARMVKSADTADLKSVMAMVLLPLNIT
jgi:hypothetical protein